jgi:hypothetical protein
MKLNKRKNVLVLILFILIAQTYLLIFENISFASTGEWDISVNNDGSIMATLNEEGILTISGTGNMKDYEYSGSVKPWNNLKGSILKIEIQEGITSIGDYTFYGLNNLQTIIMPQSITRIGQSAFGNCAKLTDITIPNGITSIENSVFEFCNNLESITIPEGVTSIGESAFRDCRRLKNIQIPHSLTTIGNMAFAFCSNLTNITMPNELIHIGESAFKSCINLTTITIPEKVANIGEMAFTKCTQLMEINVAEENSNYASIEGVLYTKDKRNLLKYPSAKKENDYKILEGTASIATYGFDSCKNLANIVIPEGLTTIGSHSFEACGNLATISMPNSLTEIREFAFSACNSLKQIKIPNGTTSIGKQAFFTCNNLANIIIPSSVTTIGEDIVNNKVQIICESNSIVESYAQKNNIIHTTDDIGPKIEIIKSESDNVGQEVKYTVNVTDEISGVEENSLKYVWSTKSKDVQIDEIVTSIKNGENIQKTTETGTYYLWVVAYDAMGNYTIQSSLENTLDNALPTLTIKEHQADKSAITITVADIGSGLTKANSYQYYVSLSDIELTGGQWTNYISGKQIIIPKGKNESYYLFLKTISDNVGNISKANGTMVMVGDEEYHRFGPYARETAEFNFDIDGNEKWQENISVQVSGLGENSHKNYGYAWVDEYNNLNVGDIANELEYVEFEQYTSTAYNEDLVKGKYKLVIIEKATNKIVAKSNTFYIGRDKTAPILYVSYPEQETIEDGTLVIISASEEIQEVEGWTLSEDNLEVSKIYSDAVTETITVKDLAGNTSSVEVVVTKIETYFEIKDYTITEENYITGIKAGTTIDELIRRASTNMNYVLKENKQEITEGLLKTGQKMELKDGTVYTIVVEGDLNGDGEIKLSDITALNKHIQNNIMLDKEYFIAADVNQDGVTDFKDLTKINKERLQLSE